jgi:hypothetical protein
MRKRVFCWFPKKIYTVKFWQNGYKWLSFAWLDNDGRHYETEEVLKVDVDYLLKMLGSNIKLSGK